MPVSISSPTVSTASGIWHLANPGAVSRLEFLRRAAELCGLPAAVLVAQETPDTDDGFRAPPSQVLASGRGWFLPPLDDALGRYLTDRNLAGFSEQERVEAVRAALTAAFSMAADDELAEGERRLGVVAPTVHILFSRHATVIHWPVVPRAAPGNIARQGHRTCR